MIDIHNHILVDVDDGPKSINEAIELLKQAKSEGATDIVASPHHLHTRYSNDIQKVKMKLNELKKIEEIKELEIRLYSGQEIRVTDQIIDDINNGKIEGINGSRYLLLEFPSNEVPHYSNQLFYELQTMGYVPIIAHPERNKAIVQNMDLLFELINGGALSQITTSSLLGEFGSNVRKLSLKMIDNNLAHFIASDAHSATHRPFVLKQLFKEKKLKTYYEELESYLKNGKAVLENEKISKLMPTQDYKQKKWFGFL
ncbi:capsular biosynthesis protein [Staphylococcus saprophyticus]|uniref:tyrosine-protein phosphatase n=1 Tax=Staphylococcus saprophyticus TaxID=29385 RepID=UPI000FF88563|nr:CpsB/CapC family capsule biosynthesis tyrosine phosphatase [Staphylococcus saprophyticus]MDW4099690.1 capsular biosynthesis protein [Staphylococcus saprophyticus]MDW4158940.1 capsular biosynthesis protein [Staphylococcus saprophyticus]MDW4161887.1 capsular biosynthesis protein [Staphylococcus saprophyticus]MDW4423665.1 capsular biosynthesis protein [Staphylococcus saprophyticus]MDW4433145.1 capsular biosynthesis protein [Staphylococcus saprophyticus]